MSMVPFRLMYIMALTISVALISGCTLSQSTMSETGTKNLNLTDIPTTSVNVPVTILSIAQTQCPVKNNMTPQIFINPIGTHQLGNVISVKGTTNIDEGDVKIFIKSSSRFVVVVREFF